MTKMLKVVGASWLQTKISSYILGLLGTLAILALFVGQMERTQEDGTYAATVFHSEKTGYHIEYWGQSNDLADIPRGVARAFFRMDINTTGWSILEVETDGSYPDEIQAYAAGIVEGALTWLLIHYHLENTIRARCASQPLKKPCDRLRDALDRSANNWKTYASENEQTDPFWHQVSLYYTQMSGVYTGWKHGVERSMNEYETDISDLYWLNAQAEITEIQQKLNISVQDPALDRLPGVSSAFLKIVNETAEDGKTSPKLFVAHNAAGSYSTMMRIIKRYKLHYHLTSADDSPPTPGVTVDFSGYPGAITSQDEFYLLRGNHHRMAVAGTAFRNFNKKLWKNVNITEQVPVGPRLTAANRLASNVSTWGRLLATSNSGTGCKQWLVVDFTRLYHLNSSQESAPSATKKDLVTEVSIGGRNKDMKHTVVHRGGGSRAKGLFWLVEQAPARTHSADLSEALLERGYWASHGLPHFKDIADLTQTTQMEESHGKMFSEAESARAMTFKRGHKNATSLQRILKLMRQINMTAINSTASDDACVGVDCILREKGYWAVLGVRGDVLSRHREAYGVIDTKVVSGSAGSAETRFYAQSGPPFNAVTRNSTAFNKGTVASIYTDQFDDEPNIDGDEMMDLLRQQLEQAERDRLVKINKHRVQPFQWSDSGFSWPKGHADKWAFDAYEPAWAW